jgi:hypothetical protein
MDVIIPTDSIFSTSCSFPYSAYLITRTCSLSRSYLHRCEQITFCSDMRAERLSVRNVWEHSVARGPVSPHGCHRCQSNRAKLSHSESPVREKIPAYFISFIVLTWSRCKAQHPQFMVYLNVIRAWPWRRKQLWRNMSSCHGICCKGCMKSRETNDNLCSSWESSWASSEMKVRRVSAWTNLLPCLLPYNSTFCPRTSLRSTGNKTPRGEFCLLGYSAGEQCSVVLSD